MIAKKTSSRMKSATVLSPKELEEAKSLLEAIKSAKEIEDLMFYQQKLEKLIEKADSNKKTLDRHVNKTVMNMKNMEKAEVLAKYSRHRSNSVIAAEQVEGSASPVAELEVPMEPPAAEEVEVSGVLVESDGSKRYSEKR